MVKGEYEITVDGTTMLVTDDISAVIKAYKSWTIGGFKVRVLSRHTSDITHIIGMDTPNE